MEEKTYFLISDIHSFCKELKLALHNAGFNKKDKNHILVVLGDIFDRGPDSVGVYNYITAIPKYRRILIRGNHEDLFLELLEKIFPESYDFSNKTVDTFCNIAGQDMAILTLGYWYKKYPDSTYNEAQVKILQAWQSIKNIVLNSKITKWLKSKEWLNYYEINNKFICTHSFIPVKVRSNLASIKNLRIDMLSEENFEYDPNWKTGDWYEARWGCPWSQYKRGYFMQEEAKGKTLICGHWHTEDFYFNLPLVANNCAEATKPNIISDIYYSNGIIGLDGGVYTDKNYKLVHPQNVLIINGHNCYNGSFDKPLKINNN